MNLCEIVVREAITTSLNSSARDEAVAEMVDTLIAAGKVDAKMRDDVLAALLEREEKGSTGFGKGVAVPHVKIEGMGEMAAAVGLSEGGIEFNSLDKQPVHSVVLLLSPAGDPEGHLRAMEVIFGHLSQDRSRRFLQQSSSAEDVWTLLEDADHERLGG